MLDESYLEKLAARARQEVLPTVDVADQVMARLQPEAPPVIWDERPLAWLTAIAAAAAIPVAFAGFLCWNFLTDPMMQVFYTLTW